jgi:hypothetical protein
MFFPFTWQHESPPGIQVGLNSMLAKLVNTHTFSDHLLLPYHLTFQALHRVYHMHRIKEAFKRVVRKLHAQVNEGWRKECFAACQGQARCGWLDSPIKRNRR